jgi:hypothetical protein
MSPAVKIAPHKRGSVESGDKISLLEYSKFFSAQILLKWGKRELGTHTLTH